MLRCLAQVLGQIFQAFDSFSRRLTEAGPSQSVRFVCDKKSSSAIRVYWLNNVRLRTDVYFNYNYRVDHIGDGLRRPNSGVQNTHTIHSNSPYTTEPSENIIVFRMQLDIYKYVNSIFHRPPHFLQECSVPLNCTFKPQIQI